MLNLEKAVAVNKIFKFSTLLHVRTFEFGIPTAVPDDTAFHDIENFIVVPEPESRYSDPQFTDSFKLQGGIMADEMGLGKTVSMLSLVIANPRIPDPKGERLGFSGLFACKASLVLCPAHIVDQWANEIKAHTKLKVYCVKTIREQKVLTYQRAAEMDIIIIPHNFLRSNKSYLNAVAGDKRAEISEKQSVIFHRIEWCVVLSVVFFK